MACSGWREGIASKPLYLLISTYSQSLPLPPPSNQSSRRILDYVEWHRQWQEGLDMTAFLDEVLAMEASDTDFATGADSDSDEG